jgi:hypothetical protein
MLAEMFMLRLETIRKASKPPTSTRSDIRFVPIRLPAISVSDGTVIPCGEPSPHLKAGPRTESRHPHDIPGRRGCGVECPSMHRISNWIDGKPYRFHLILLGHTAVLLCALLIAMAGF